ncbi:hypothetical protein bthur0007_57460 [Bacillus thuringiensis serovar monterrey BGSC 4AJ1]|nr:hypothetical protein bthur0007_57460 [Bacillus thuringiensis serovar monterrey BGSC 4AJ1]
MLCSTGKQLLRYEHSFEIATIPLLHFYSKPETFRKQVFFVSI